MAVPIDPTGVAFLTAETRAMPMHVAGLSIYAKPEGAGEDYVRSVYQDMISVDEVAPVFGKRPL